ncbi:DNA damage-binding protein 2-like [Dermacentor andersoni]|uniref:DNA damage-binding protein 2-like n=1 Tax=Dermacentor andersoni TaxID=34620 RepID=UPI003B3A2992
MTGSMDDEAGPNRRGRRSRRGAFVNDNDETATGHRRPRNSASTKKNSDADRSAKKSSRKSANEKKSTVGVINAPPKRKDNLVQCLNNSFLRDRSSHQQLCKMKRHLLAREVLGFTLANLPVPMFTESARVTCLQWHPTRPNLLAVGSKNGEIVLWNAWDPKKNASTPPTGSGSAVAAIKFHPENASLVYTATLLSRVMLQDFGGAEPQVFWDTESERVWFTALDVLHERKMVLAGDNMGSIYAFSTTGELMWPQASRLHKGKVKYLEFVGQGSDLLISASVDHTVRIWDVRKLGGPNDFLIALPHTQGVNSAYVSPSDRSSLLTTDQKNELRVYRGPAWQEPLVIPHPHRQFQHLTPIQASWHPLENLIVVGRYPDKNFNANDTVRGIDVFDGSTGESLGKVQGSLDVPGICSLTAFSCSGEVLAAGTGFHTVIFQASSEE